MGRWFVYAGIYFPTLSQKHVWEAAKRKFQRVLGLVRILAWHHCEFKTFQTHSFCILQYPHLWLWTQGLGKSFYFGGLILYYKYFEQTLSTYQIKCFCEINNWNINDTFCYLHFSYSWRTAKILSTVDRPEQNSHFIRVLQAFIAKRVQYVQRSYP